MGGVGAATLGLGYGLGHFFLGPNNQWWDAEALVDYDDRNGRYRFNGVNYETLAAFLAAIGGTAAGKVLSVGPLPTGNVVYQSDFSAGVDGWADSPGYESAGEPSASGGDLTFAATAAYRAYRAIPVDKRRAFRARGRRVSQDTSSASLNAGSGNAGTSSSVVSVPLSTDGAEYAVIAGSGPAVMNVGVVLGAGGHLAMDDLSVEEVYPYAGWSVGELGFDLDVTFPASFTGTEVLLQWGHGDEDTRLRLECDASGNVVLRVTYNQADQAALPIGTVTAGSAHRIRASAAQDGFYANIDGGPIQADTAGLFGGFGLFWLGRGMTGNPFTGSIDRLKVYPTARSNPNQLIEPTRAFRVYGDSTASEVGASAVGSTGWCSMLTAAYNPHRAYAKNGAGGENTDQLLARVTADAEFYRRWTTIFMDRPNTGETPAAWAANLKAAVALLRTDRWFVMPPAQDSVSTLNPGIANIAEVQALLLSDSFFAGHTFDAAAQASYLAAVTADTTRVGGTDFIHFSDAGQAIQAAHIKPFFDLAGW